MDKNRMKALEIISGIADEGAFSGQILDRALSGDKELKKEDRAFITELVYGTIGKLTSIDRIIDTYSSVKTEKMEKWVLNAIRMAVYQMEYLDRVPAYAAINEAVEEVKTKSPNASGFTNGVLRGILRGGKKVSFKSQEDKLSYTYSMPMWITEKLSEQYPRNIRGILSAMSLRPELSLRINKTLISPQDYKKLLSEEEMEYSEGKILNEIVSLKEQGAVRELPGFNEGYFSVQNESSALVSLTAYECLKEMGKEKDGEVFDICAAPGGKTAFLSELTEGKVKILSSDLHPHRVELMEENYRRLKLENIETAVNDAENYKSGFSGRFDVVILDAPCSGFGLMGKKPDIKVNISEEGIQYIISVQRKILENAGKYVKDGGYLIYSTCTLNKDENEKNVMRFINDNPDFSVSEKEYFPLRGNFINNSGMITILPDGHFDGFFISVLRKERNEEMK